MIAAAKKVQPWKTDLVEEMARLIAQHSVIGIADMSNLPASQFQLLRQKLRGEAKLIVAKNTLIRLALQKAAGLKPGVEKLCDYVRGQTCLILTEKSPFELNRILAKSRTKAPARPGSVAAADIVIPAGETDLPPGPVVGELQRAGIKARIQAGKVVVTEDCRLLKAGDVITKEISEVLAKFGILPVELGLRMRAAFEQGMVYAGEVLEIDEEKVMSELGKAITAGFCLSLNAGYPTALTVGIMLAEAERKAIGLAVACRFPVDKAIPSLIAVAFGEMLSLARRVGEVDPSALDDDLRRMIGSAEATPVTEEKPKKEEVEEKPKEGEELSGLGALFG